MSEIKTNSNTPKIDVHYDDLDLYESLRSLGWGDAGGLIAEEAIERLAKVRRLLEDAANPDGVRGSYDELTKGRKN